MGETRDSKPHGQRSWDVVPTPGQRSPKQAGMNNYIVSFSQEEVSLHAHSSRRALYEGNVARAKEFQRRIKAAVQEAGADEEVGAIGEAVGFPMEALMCTPRVANLIKALPGVEAVVQDADDLEIK